MYKRQELIASWSEIVGDETSAHSEPIGVEDGVLTAVSYTHLDVYKRQGQFTLLSMPVEEYPTLPEVSENSGVLKAEDFANAIAQVAVAASRDDVTPVITGVQLEVSDNQLSLVATDRYRVAVREIEWDLSLIHI